MYSKKVTVLNQVGLFARPATFFTQCANSFQTVSIWIEMNEKRVNAKSLLGILSLGVVGGSEITIIADSKINPEDEIEAVDALERLIVSGFVDAKDIVDSKKNVADSNGDINAAGKNNGLEGKNVAL